MHEYMCVSWGIQKHHTKRGSILDRCGVSCFTDRDTKDERGVSAFICDRYNDACAGSRDMTKRAANAKPRRVKHQKIEHPYYQVLLSCHGSMYRASAAGKLLRTRREIQGPSTPLSRFSARAAQKPVLWGSVANKVRHQCTAVGDCPLKDTA